MPKRFHGLLSKGLNVTNFLIAIILLAMAGLLSMLLFVKQPSEHAFVRVFVPQAMQSQASN